MITKKKLGEIDVIAKFKAEAALLEIPPKNESEHLAILEQLATIILENFDNFNLFSVAATNENITTELLSTILNAINFDERFTSTEKQALFGAIAKNKKTSEQMHETIVGKTDDREILLAIIKNPATHWHTIKLIAEKSDDPTILLAIAELPHASILMSNGTLQIIVKKFFEQKISEQKILSVIVKNHIALILDSPDTLSMIAEKSTDPATLTALVNTTKSDIYYEVLLKNKNIDGQTLLAIVTKTSKPEVLLAIARNKNIDADLLKMVAEKSDDPEVLLAIVECPIDAMVNSDMLQAIVEKSTEQAILSAAIKKEAVNKKILLIIAEKSTDPKTLMAVLTKNTCPFEVLKKICENKNADIDIFKAVVDIIIANKKVDNSEEIINTILKYIAASGNQKCDANLLEKMTECDCTDNDFLAIIGNLKTSPEMLEKVLGAIDANYPDVKGIAPDLLAIIAKHPSANEKILTHIATYQNASANLLNIIANNKNSGPQVLCQVLKNANSGDDAYNIIKARYDAKQFPMNHGLQVELYDVCMNLLIQNLGKKKEVLIGMNLMTDDKKLWAIIGNRKQ